MGVVYLAQDTRLGREVAIKVLPETSDRDLTQRARFEREARMLASLNHPNIGAIYDLHPMEGGEFLVLEYVPGETLAQRIHAGPPSWKEAAGAAQQIAGALEAAHAKGIIHRDLKPGNIMITPEGIVKVLDFGLAKSLVPASADTCSMDSQTIEHLETVPGTILGTPTYMSPEQARGMNVDHRSDIWAFGCVLFEMLTGKKAFDGKTATDRIAAVITRDPDWDILPREIPRSIRELLRRCLEKETARRLDDIRSAREILHAAFTEADSGSGQGRFSRLPARRLAAAGLGLALLVLLAAAWLFWKSEPTSLAIIPDKKFLLVLPFKDLSSKAADSLLGDGMAEVLSARLSQLQDIQIVMPGIAVFAARNLDPFRIARDVGANLLLDGSVQRSGEQVRVTFSLWNRVLRRKIAGRTLDGPAADLFGVQDRLAEEVVLAMRLSFGPADVRRKPSGLETADEQERYLAALGRLQRSDREAFLDEAVAVLGELSRQRPAAPLVWAALGRGYLQKFKLTRDRKWIQLADSACARARQLDPDFPEVEVTVGEMRLASGQTEAAIAAFQHALSIQPAHYQAILGLASAYSSAGRVREAESAFQRAIGLQPDHWTGYSRLAGFYYNRGNYTRAAEMFRKVTELTPDNAMAFANLGSTEQVTGDFERALQSLKKSLALQPTARAYSNLGTIEFYRGHFQEAVDAFESAVRLAPDHFEMWANLADGYRWAPGLQGKAKEAFSKSAALCRSELTINPKSALAHSVFSLCLAKTGQREEAVLHTQEALSIARTPNLLYNAAIVAHLAQQPREAMEWLVLAVQSGYPRIYISRDPELFLLKGNPLFQELVREKK